MSVATQQRSPITAKAEQWDVFDNWDVFFTRVRASAHGSLSTNIGVSSEEEIKTENTENRLPTIFYLSDFYAFGYGSTSPAKSPTDNPELVEERSPEHAAEFFAPAYTYRSYSVNASLCCEVSFGTSTDTATGVVLYPLTGTVNLSEGFAKFRDQIGSFEHLPEGWDSYDAKAPTKEAVSKALRLLDKLKEEDCLPNAVIPTSDSSILVRYVYGERTFRWEFYSDGEVAYSRDINGAPREYFDVTDEKLELPLISF